MRLATAVLLIAVAGLGCQTPGLMALPNLYAQSGQNPFESTPPALQKNEVKVLFATDRVAKSETPEDQMLYGFGRSTFVSCGICTVSFGKDVGWDELVDQSLERPRKNLLTPNIISTRQMLRFPDTADYASAGLSGGDYAELESDAVSKLHALLREQLAACKRKDVYLLIHGYNVQFGDAAKVMSELWHFLGRDGVPAIYTWPAGYGGIRGYTVDRESGEYTIWHLKRFLLALASCPEVENIHIIAHSRGTDVALTAIRELNIQFQGAGKKTGEELKLQNVVLAAPDLDLQVVSQRVIPELVINVPDRMTIYICEKDRAIGLAGWIFGSVVRLGRLPLALLSPLQRERLDEQTTLDLIDAKIKRPDIFGHSYFYQDPAVSSDLILVLKDNREPGAANGRPLTKEGSRFWGLDAGYPNLDRANKATAGIKH